MVLRPFIWTNHFPPSRKLLSLAIPVRGVFHFKRRFFKVRMAHLLVAGSAFFSCPVNEMDHGENAGDDRRTRQ